MHARVGRLRGVDGLFKTGRNIGGGFHFRQRRPRHPPDDAQESRLGLRRRRPCQRQIGTRHGDARPHLLEVGQRLVLNIKLILGHALAFAQRLQIALAVADGAAREAHLQIGLNRLQQDLLLDIAVKPFLAVHQVVGAAVLGEVGARTKQVQAAGQCSLNK